MFETIRSFVEALKGPSAEALEQAYLEDAADRYDLEMRQREIDRGLFRRAPGGIGGLPVLQ